MAVAVEDRVAEAARAAVVATAGDESSVGPMLGSEPGADGLISVRFACTLPGYNGWEWAADLAVIDDTVTVCESALLPGSDALLAPTWVPWSERVQPGDLEAGMILPYQAEDQRLIPGYTETGDDDRDAIANFEFGLGRERVLAPEARESARREQESVQEHVEQLTAQRDSLTSYLSDMRALLASDQQKLLTDLTDE